MPDTQNAFTVPSPASQQARPAKPSQPRQARQAHQTSQAKPSYKHVNKEADAAKNEEQDNELTSFTALLSQISGQTDDKSAKPDAVHSAGLVLPAGQGDKPENGAAEGLPAGGNGKPFPKPVLDLMASLKAGLEGLEDKGVDVNALSEEMTGILNELTDSSPDWNLKALEAMLSKLQAQAGSAAVPEEGEPQDTETKGQKTHIKFRPEAPLAGSAEQEAEEEPEEPGKMPAEGLENELNKPQAGWHAAPVEAQTDEAGNADQPQTLTVSKFHSYLKPDVPKEAAPAQDAKPAEDNAGKNASGGAAAVRSRPEAKTGGELPDSSTGQGEQGEKQGSDPRRDAHAPARSAPVKEAADPEKGAEEPKARTNFTENRTAFEHFFDSVMARRDAAPAAPQLELAKGSPLSQAETLREGLDNVVRFIRANGVQRANVIVDPPALGRISVELTSSSTGLDASIKVSSEQVRQLIQDHLTQLKLSLEQQGVQLTHFSVDVQQDNERRNQGQGQENKRRRTAGITGADEEEAADEEALFRVDLNQGLLYWVA